MPKMHYESLPKFGWKTWRARNRALWNFRVFNFWNFFWRVRFFWLDWGRLDIFNLPIWHFQKRNFLIFVDWVRLCGNLEAGVLMSALGFDWLSRAACFMPRGQIGALFRAPIKSELWFCLETLWKFNKAKH